MREVKSLSRGLQILELLAESDNGIANGELARILATDKSVISRYVYTLMVNGYAEIDDGTGRYKAGPKIVRLSHKMLKRMPIRDEAMPFLRQLVKRTGESSHLAIGSEKGALHIAHVRANVNHLVSTEVGTIVPYHCTAIGKVILAFDGAPVPEKLEKHTHRTIVNHEIMNLHLEQIRQQGFAVDDEEDTIGVRCIAAPVFGINDRFLGSIGISGPGTRLTYYEIEEFAPIVVESAKELSDRLGFKE